MDTNECVTTIFNERSKFILIGLTGRTGSGCSEAAKILASKEFNKLNLKSPKNQDFDSKDEIKYRIIYNYAKNNWEGFYILSMSDIIFSFIIQHKIDNLNLIFKTIIPSWNESFINEVLSDSSYVALYNATHESFAELLSDNKTLKRETEEQLKREYQIIANIKYLHERFKSVAAKYSLSYIEKSDNCQKSEKANAYSFLWQCLGNKIRESGDIENSEQQTENIFCIARRANDFIKAIRKYNSINQKNTLICIDAIRDPYEAHYFKDRYSAFYLVSVNTEEGERRNRLGNLTNEQIKSLDTTEYTKKLNGTEKFTHQNLAGCIEISDIHIYNPHSNIPEKYFLTEQLIKYVMLIKHPGLITPTHIERCMQIAYNAKLSSGCLSRQVGATITDENYSVKAIGWNEVPEGQIPCNLRDIFDLNNNKDYNIFSDFEIEDEEFSKTISEKCDNLRQKNLCGRCYQYCFKDIYNKVKNNKNQVHTRALHAEENAFLQLAKYGGQGIKGGNLFTTASPCELCSKKAYQLGIKNIYYIDPYPGISIRHILSFKNAHDEKPQMHLFVGAVGQAYTALYSQKLSIKDELELLTVLPRSMCSSIQTV